jgi:hypothetical protein
LDQPTHPDPGALGEGAVSHELLLSACRQLLVPLARLAVARGLPYAELDELVREAFVQAAREAHPGIAPHRAVSRISAATGLNRREVTRLVQKAGDKPADPQAEPTRRRSPATETFTRWLSDPQYRGADGAPRTLPRQGPAPSFESLAQSVTRDVHPRSLLEEICRLGLARIDEASDHVELLRETFVPQGDDRRLFGFLGANVGDHLSAAVDNVLSEKGSRHLEQAMFADELSPEAIAAIRPLVTAQWQSLVRSLVPEVRRLIDEDNRTGRPQGQRLRVGLYAYATGAAAPDSPKETRDEGP